MHTNRRRTRKTEEDLIKTIELVEDLKHIRSLIMPLFLVPLSRLKNEQWFKETKMTKLHDFYWIDDLIGLSFAGKMVRKTNALLYRIFVKIIERKAKEKGIY